MNTLLISNSNANSALLATPKADLPASGKNDQSLEHMKYVEKQLNTTQKVLAEEKLTISEQALAMFRQDSIQEQTSTSTSDDKNDKLIGKIKEQIEAVKQKLSRLKNDKGEVAEQERRQLQLQLATLNASMLDLLGKKLDAV